MPPVFGSMATTAPRRWPRAAVAAICRLLSKCSVMLKPGVGLARAISRWVTPWTFTSTLLMPGSPCSDAS